MAVRNVPHCDCDALKTNLMIAAGIGELVGDATRYGGFKAAVSMTQDRTLNALDPRECGSKIYEVAGGNYGLTLEYHTQDCTPLTELLDYSFDCDEGDKATPTTSNEQFEIDQNSGFNVTIDQDLWNDTCCDVEPYYRQIAEMRASGRASAQAMQDTINRAMDTIGRFDRTYNAKLVAERISHSMNAPVTGELAKMNEFVLTKLGDGKGYNHVKDIVTGDPVGDAIWEVPVLYSQDPLAPVGAKRIDTSTFRREMIRFVRSHPRCGAGFTIIGGSKFEELYDQLGILACCDANGVDQGAQLRSALGFLGNLQIDDTIDDMYGDGSFFIVENNVLAFFWFTLFNDPRYRTANKTLITTATGRKWVEHIAGYRDSGVANFLVGNCRDGSTVLNYDMWFNTQQTLGCFDNPSFNFQFRSQYGMWSHPAIGCADMNPQTGIYQGQLVGIGTAV